MAPLFDALLARAPHAADRARARREDPAVEQSRIVGSGDGRMIEGERDAVRSIAASEPRRYAERLRAPSAGARAGVGADEGRAPTRPPRARAAPAPLRKSQRDNT